MSNQLWWALEAEGFWGGGGERGKSSSCPYRAWAAGGSWDRWVSQDLALSRMMITHFNLLCCLLKDKKQVTTMNAFSYINWPLLWFVVLINSNVIINQKRKKYRHKTTAKCNTITLENCQLLNTHERLFTGVFHKLLLGCDKEFGKDR